MAFEDVAFYASRSHYAAHLEPVRDAVGGVAFGTRQSLWGRLDTPTASLVVVASAVDALRFADRRVVYIEHGSGQSYQGDPDGARSSSYSGGPGLGHVVLFVCPNEAVAARWSAVYPDAVTAVVGCARLDQHHDRRAVRLPGLPRVAFTFHWDCKLCPETRSGWRWWRDTVIGCCQATGYEVAASAHPRAPGTLSTFRSMGVPVFDDVDKLLSWADVLVADNTSALYEACALGVGTVVLNAPWYRRDMDHGLRFWSHVPGRMIDEKTDLEAAIRAEIEHPDDYRYVREHAAQAAYGGMVDGQATKRAAAAIIAVV